MTMYQPGYATTFCFGFAAYYPTQHLATFKIAILIDKKERRVRPANWRAAPYVKKLSSVRYSTSDPDCGGGSVGASVGLTLSATIFSAARISGSLTSK